MTHHEIERRLAESGLELAAKQEILRIYDCLSDRRKIEILDDWENLITRIKRRYAQLQEERLLLITDPLSTLAERYEQYLKDFYRQNAGKNLRNLQTNI